MTGGRLADKFTPISEEQILAETGRTVEQWNELAAAEWKRLVKEFNAMIVDASRVHGSDDCWAPMVMSLLLSCGADLLGNYIIHSTDLQNAFQRCRDVQERAHLTCGQAFDAWKAANPLNFVPAEGSA